MSALNKTAAKLVSELFQKREIDDVAETAKEIANKNQLSVRQTTRQIESWLASGKIEQVWKHGTIRLVPAYRIKRK